MKRTLTLTFPTAGLAALLALTGCDKPATPPDSPQAATPAVEAVAPVDAAAALAYYGFAAKIPADAEVVLAGYHWSTLWKGAAASKWMTALLGMNMMQEGEFKDMRDQWENDGQAQIAKRVLAAVLGDEVYFVGGKGMVKSAEFLGQISSQLSTLGALSQSGASPAAANRILLPIVADAEVPPVFVASHCPSIRKDMEALIGQAKSKMNASPKPGVTLGTMTVGDTSFETLTIDFAKVIEANRDQVSAMLSQSLPDPADAAAVMAKLEKKTLSLAWGWSGDHFVLSLGPDQSHLQLAASPAQSILAHPAVAPHVNAMAGQKPFLVSYMAKTVQEIMQEPVNLSAMLDTYGASLQGMVDDATMVRVRTDLEAFQKRHESEKAEFTDSVGIGWWDGGVNMSSWGGPVIKESPQPLKLAGTLTPSTILHIDGTRGEHGATRAWIEDFATMAYAWYNDLVSAKLPPETQQQAGMATSLGLPVLQKIWTASGLLNDALGNESAFIVEGDGRMPVLPGAPMPEEFAAKARIPRIAWVAELKEPAKLTESWAVFKGLIDEFAPMMEQQIPGGMPAAQSRPAGKAETFFFPLPMDTGDLLPHVATTPEYWMFSTAPSLTESIAAAPASTGGAAHMRLRIQPPAMADMAAALLSAMGTEAPNGPSPAELADIRTGLTLLRSLVNIDTRIFTDSTGTRSTLSMKMEDLK